MKKSLISCSVPLVVRLSKSMKESGEGRLEAWNADSNSWQAVCGENWNTTYQSDTACHLLGYRHTENTWIKDVTTFQSLEPYNRVGTAIGRQTQMKVLFDKSRNKGCRNGNNMTVHLKCKHFGNQLMRGVGRGLNFRGKIFVH